MVNSIEQVNRTVIKLAFESNSSRFLRFDPEESASASGSVLNEIKERGARKIRRLFFIVLWNRNRYHTLR